MNGNTNWQCVNMEIRQHGVISSERYPCWFTFISHLCFKPFWIKCLPCEMSEDGLKIVEDNASFIAVAKTRNVRVLNLITFKDYWHRGT